MTSQTSAQALLRHAAVFLPAAVPREGRVAFWAPDGDPLPAMGTPTPLCVVRPHGDGVRGRTVPAVTFSVASALPLLARAARSRAAHPATRAWGTTAVQALSLAARGRLLPGLTPEGVDAWRAGPLDAADVDHLRAVAAALPYEGYA
ncbi:ATP-dependent helicase, partial [Streptomyces sp. NPDC059233]